MGDIRGICPIISATFTENGELDEQSLTNMLRKLIRGGCHGLTLFGIGGEFYKLSDDERHIQLDIVVEECKDGGVPAIVSVTQHSTELAVKEARAAEQAGANCLMLLPPFFLAPTSTDLYRHIAAVGQAVDIPVMVQYVPQRTGVAIDPALFEKLTREVENVCYFKIECRPSGAYITRLMDAVGENVRVFGGSAGFYFPAELERGIVGLMPGSSMYDVYLKIYHLFQAGRRAEAIQVHNVLLPMLNHIHQNNVEMIIHYEKRILKRRGLITSDYCRRPTFTPDENYDRMFETYYEQVSPYFEEEESPRPRAQAAR